MVTMGLSLLVAWSLAVAPEVSPPRASPPPPASDGVFLSAAPTPDADDLMQPEVESTPELLPTLPGPRDDAMLPSHASPRLSSTPPRPAGPEAFMLEPRPRPQLRRERAPAVEFMAARRAPARLETPSIQPADRDDLLPAQSPARSEDALLPASAPSPGADALLPTSEASSVEFLGVDG